MEISKKLSALLGNSRLARLEESTYREECAKTHARNLSNLRSAHETRKIHLKQNTASKHSISKLSPILHVKEESKNTLDTCYIQKSKIRSNSTISNEKSIYNDYNTISGCRRDISPAIVKREDSFSFQHNHENSSSFLTQFPVYDWSKGSLPESELGNKIRELEMQNERLQRSITRKQEENKNLTQTLHKTQTLNKNLIRLMYENGIINEKHSVFTFFKTVS